MYGFPAEVTFASANIALAAAAANQSGAERLYDLSACEQFDSSLIAVLLELKRRAQANGALCRFQGASAKLRELAGLYGADPLLFEAGAVR